MSSYSWPVRCWWGFFSESSAALWPAEKSKKRPGLVPVFVFIFSFVFSHITVHMSLQRSHRMASLPVAALFGAVRFHPLLSLPCFVGRLANPHCVSHFVFLMVSAALWSVSHFPLSKSSQFSGLLDTLCAAGMATAKLALFFFLIAIVPQQEAHLSGLLTGLKCSQWLAAERMMLSF